MSTPHILVVDDNVRSRIQLSQCAEATACKVHVCVDGAEALDACKMTSFDLIITDVHMPRMDAFAFIPALRRLPHYADVPVLVVTSDISRRTKIELLEAGADDFLLKPLDTLELGQKLRRLLKTSALMANLGVVTAQRDAAQDSLAERNAELERLTMGLVAALEKANVLNDSDTGNHIRRVCRYAALLANAHGCSASYTEQVYHYAGLHDVGKVGIRDGILKKPGKLTPQEFDEMKGHTLLGYDLLKAAGLPAVALNIAVSHHERWDGTGYPHSLKGEDIPLEARLVAVVDVFDALVSKRCYKEGFELEGAVKILQDSAGSHLDPQLVHKFLSKMDDILKIRTTFSDEPLPLSGWG